MKTMERRWEMIKTPLSFWFLAAAIAAVMTGCDGGGGSGDISPFTVEDGVGAADFDGDGRTDIALAATYISHSPPHPGSLLFYLQRPDGTFMPPVSYPIGSDPWQVAIADVNGDGLPDVMSANTESSDISVVLNNPAQPGALFSTKNYSCAPGPYSVAVGDLNGDGLEDIAVAIQKSTPGGLSFLFQDAADPGGFLPAVHLDTGFPSISVAVRDLDGDGSNDLVLTGSNSVSVLLQDAANPGTFLAGVVYPTGTRASFVAAADLDDDGFQDLVVTNEGSSNDGSNASVSVLLQDPSDPGTFEPASNYPVANGAQNAVVGDLNGDDAPDIAVVSLVYSAQQPSRVTVWFQDPTMPGKFSSSGVFEGGFSSNFIALGDFNGDGILDILINDGPLILFQNPSSPGSFFAASPLPT